MIPIEVQYQARYALSRRYFWDYCKETAEDFYKEDRTFLKEFCQALQDFFYGDSKIMVINMPPRHGKSRTIGKFTEWLFGNDNRLKVMTGSYNEKLSSTFAKHVRDTILEADGEYSKIFPYTNIKPGEATMNKWALNNNPEANYLATSPTGTATGFGCNLMIIDDTIRDVKEAYNENYLNDIIDWFNNTMLSRTEVGFKIIVVMTRWSKKDLAGYILENYENVVHISYKAVQEDGSMLCEEILSREDYDFKTKNMNKDIVFANYQQETIDIKGRLYSKFLTYRERPTFKYIMNYTDTADEGSDYLCSINYGVDFQGIKYVLDILYTKEPMEKTEPATADLLTKDKVGYAKIESNNGGRGFARAVQRLLKEKKNRHTRVDWFHQSENKKSRIFSNATGVMNDVIFPEGWENRWPEFYKSMTEYQKEGKNAHDDAQDTVTGVYENSSPNTMQFGYNPVV
jgi:predicted phage terminase large subunit-like protein